MYKEEANESVDDLIANSFGSFALGDVDQVKANKIVDDLMDTSSVIYGVEEGNGDFVSRAICATRHVPVDAP
jgi:hypothetical protein